MLFIQELLDHNQFQNNDSIKMIYLELLCKNFKKRVLPELRRKDNYPTDLAINLCKLYEVFDALAYLYFETGQLRQAVEIKIQIFKLYYKKLNLKYASKLGQTKIEKLKSILEDLVFSCALSIRRDEQVSFLQYTLIDQVFSTISLERISETKEDTLDVQILSYFILMMTKNFDI